MCWSLGILKQRAAFVSVLLAAAGVNCARLGAEEVSFRNDVMAVLSKAGCNTGPCHGNANGKAGFKLSLRGEDPEFDHLALSRDQFGRRVNLADPEQSLILLKPTTGLSHEGGKRFSKDSWEYQTLLRWISAGARPDPKDAPRLKGLEVAPRQLVLLEPAETVQLSAQASFSDGSTRDVSRIAVYEPANSLAAVSPEGLVRRQGFGEVTVLVRYLDLQVPVRLAFVPARPGFTWQPVAAHNYIDEHILAKLRTLRMNPSPLCSDEVFQRRAYLDLLGLLPSAEQARLFARSSAPDKRARLIDELLKRPEFADFWALKWGDLLRNEERTLDQKGVQNFHQWIRQSIAQGLPLDDFVRELIAGRGSTYTSPAANYYRANRNPVARAEAAAQVFLGTRLQCAQCHNHPFDRWTQDDYYGWAALFSGVQYKILENRRQDSNDSHEFKGEQIVFVSRKGSVKNPRTGQPAPARFLGAAASSPGEAASSGSSSDLLTELADWITSPENPYFARSQVNRIWYHLMGRGIVDPIDDFRPTNPPSHPELLEALAGDFVAHGFDLRYVIRLIMNSRAYQVSSEPNDTNQGDEINYSRTVVRRLSAEQLLDCQNQVLAVPSEFLGYPVGLRAAELPGSGPERVRGRRSNQNAPDKFLAVFGKPARLLTCECERSTETTMSQAFQLISGPAVNELLATEDNRLGKLVASACSSREIVEELYWTALTRAPAEHELAAAAEFLDRAKDRRTACEDLAWGLLNAKEFLLRR